jgi:hypothetical protein
MNQAIYQMLKEKKEREQLSHSRSDKKTIIITIYIANNLELITS